MLATIVDTDALWRIALTGIAGGVGVVVVYALGIGAVTNARNAEAPAATRAVWMLATLVCALLLAAAIFFGIKGMTTKS